MTTIHGKKPNKRDLNNGRWTAQVCEELLAYKCSG